MKENGGIIARAMKRLTRGLTIILIIIGVLIGQFLLNRHSAKIAEAIQQQEIGVLQQ